MASRFSTPAPRVGERVLVLEQQDTQALDLTALAIAICGIGSWLLPAVGFCAGWL